AIARPMPRLAPVTITERPASSRSMRCSTPGTDQRCARPLPILPAVRNPVQRLAGPRIPGGRLPRGAEAATISALRIRGPFAGPSRADSRKHVPLVRIETSAHIATITIAPVEGRYDRAFMDALTGAAEAIGEDPTVHC